jgi:hypothetical protein
MTVAKFFHLKNALDLHCEDGRPAVARSATHFPRRRTFHDADLVVSESTKEFLFLVAQNTGENQTVTSL